MIDWNRVLFAVVVVVLGTLVALGKVEATMLLAVVGWLMPSPVTPVATKLPPAAGGGLFVLAMAWALGACGASQTEKNAVVAASFTSELEACTEASDTARVAQDCWCAVAKKYRKPCPGIRSDGGAF